MTIEWRTARRVVYLVEVAYVEEDGDAATARWCGPNALTGSGLALPRAGSSTIYVWEGRCSGLSLSESLQPPPEALPRMGSVSLSVAAQADEALLDELQRGRWTNGTVSIWAHDLDTGEGEGLWAGRVSGEPSWTMGGATIEAEWAIGALGAEIVCTTLPEDASGWDKLTNYSGGSNETWTAPSGANIQGPIWPNRYGLHSSLAGKVLAPTWGHGADGWTWTQTGTATPPDPMPGSWVECIVYGAKAVAGAPATGPYYWIHVCPQLGVFVYDLIVVGAHLAANTIIAAGAPVDGGEWPFRASRDASELVTGYNQHADAGPIGTFARVKIPTFVDGGLTFARWQFPFRDSDLLPPVRVFALVTGLNSAGDGGANYDLDDNPFLNSPTGDGGAGVVPSTYAATFGPDDPLTARDRLDQILEDVVEDATITEDADNLYTGEPAAWWGDAPASVTGAALTRRMGPLLPRLGAEPPRVSAVVGAVLGPVGAALVRRWDATASAIRWLPIWLGPEGVQTAEIVLQRGHLQRSEPASVSGSSGRRFGVVRGSWPEWLLDGWTGDGGGIVTSGGVDYGMPGWDDRSRKPTAKAEDAAVVAAAGPEEARAQVPYLQPLDPTPDATPGYRAVADELLDLVSARPIVIRASIGFAVAMRARLGMLASIDAPGVPASVGQIRSWSVDVDAGEGQIEIVYQPR